MVSSLQTSFPILPRQGLGFIMEVEVQYRYEKEKYRKVSQQFLVKSNFVM